MTTPLTPSMRRVITLMRDGAELHGYTLVKDGQPVAKVHDRTLIKLWAAGLTTTPPHILRRPHAELTPAGQAVDVTGYVYRSRTYDY